MKTKAEDFYKIGKSYILVFIGDGIIKIVESIYEKDSSELYGSFKCGVEIRKENFHMNGVLQFFNITNSKLNDLLNCSLYVFASMTEVNLHIKPLIAAELEQTKHKADQLLKQYMKLADDCTAIENTLSLIENNKIEITKL
jgi:hypothetical protein